MLTPISLACIIITLGFNCYDNPSKIDIICYIVHRFSSCKLKSKTIFTITQANIYFLSQPFFQIIFFKSTPLAHINNHHTMTPIISHPFFKKCRALRSANSYNTYIIFLNIRFPVRHLQFNKFG